MRTFTGTLPPDDIMTELRSRVASAACDHHRIVVVDSAMSGNIGSYGVISKAPAWLALVTDGSDESALRCAIEAEKIVLYLTSVNVGTCWVAGHFQSVESATCCRYGGKRTCSRRHTLRHCDPKTPTHRVLAIGADTVVLT